MGKGEEEELQEEELAENLEKKEQWRLSEGEVHICKKEREREREQNGAESTSIANPEKNKFAMYPMEIGGKYACMYAQMYKHYVL